MSNIRLIEKGFWDCTALQAALATTKWNERPLRTQSPESPHYECDDVWVRYASPMEPTPSGPHISVWYPVVRQLPIRALATKIMTAVGGKTLGGVLITRIPAGKAVKPHKDSGWHAEFYEKYAISIKADKKQAFCFEDSNLVTEDGDLWTFVNQNVHWVFNNSTEDRITAIFCIKRGG